ncbi:rho guanine nucleotide exchange factor 39-like [Spheniscus humboldti]
MEAPEGGEEQLRKNKSFQQFKKLQETRPQFQGRKLEDLLPLPLQNCTNIICKRENSLQLLWVQKLLKGQKPQVLTPGHWYIWEGWLLVVPSKGELKRGMFFLFSDIFIATKPCHPLHLLNSNKFTCQAVYLLHQCIVDKVFGHMQSQGGLLSLSFPHKTLLLMSSDQQDINDWYWSLTAAVRQLKA